MLGFDLVMGQLYPQPAPSERVTTQAATPTQQVAIEGGAAAVAAQRRDPATALARGERLAIAAPEVAGSLHPGGARGDDIALAAQRRDLATALASGERNAIDAPEVAGSINPVGARVDDIVLKSHRQTVDEDSGPVRLFSPDGTLAQQFAQFGWVGEGVRLPDAQTVWQTDGGPLAPDRPVTLTWDNGEGQLFTLRFEI